MRIGVDARILGHDQGYDRIMLSFLKALLAAEERRQKFIVLMQPGEQATELLNLGAQVMPSNVSPLAPLTEFRVAQLWRSMKLQVYLGLYPLPVSPVPCSSFLMVPTLPVSGLPPLLSKTIRRQERYYARKLPQSLHRAQGLIPVSEESRRQLLTISRVLADRMIGPFPDPDDQLERSSEVLVQQFMRAVVEATGIEEHAYIRS